MANTKVEVGSLVSEPATASARWATIVITAIAVARLMVSLQAQVRFDTDPAINPDTFAGIGPAGSFALDVALFIASAVAFAVEARSGRGVRGWLVACAAAPGLAVFFHGSTDAMSLFRGSTWLAAAMAFVAAAHLGRHPELRQLLVAGCVAAAIPLAIRGGEQILVDHRDTVAFFEAHKAEMLAERGWTADGPAALMFERRLRQLEATGWFGLSNMFSSVMAFGALSLGVLSFAALRNVRERGDSAVPAVIALVGALVCGTLIAVNGSKGSIVATGLGALVGLVAWRRPRYTTIAALAALLLAASAPALRGLLPESFLNERSLLFRSQYLRGALSMLPQSLPFGIGPDSFQAAYMQLKPARSPEDVVSAHAMTVDWIVLLGPLALAWIALVVRAFCGRSSALPSAAMESLDDHPRTSALPAAVILAAVVFALQAIAEQSLFDDRWILVRTAAAMAFAVAIVIVVQLQERVSRVALEAALAAALVAVFAQAQIEMILFQPGTVVWAMVALGAFLAPTNGWRLERSDQQAAKRWGWIGAGLATAAACAIAMMGLLPQWRQDRQMDAAAAAVASIAQIRERWPSAAKELATNAMGPATQELLRTVHDAAGVELESKVKQAIASTANVPTRMEGIVRTLRLFDANQRAHAADFLQAADAEYPENRTALEAAIKQLAVAGRRTVGPRRTEIVEPMLHQLAVQLAVQGTERTKRPFAGAKFHVMLADLLLEEARASPNQVSLTNATAAIGQALSRQPRSARLYAELGDTLAAKGDAAGAVDAYERSLGLNRDMELDPVAQFSDRQRAEIESRLGITRAARDSGVPLSPGWPFVASNQASNATAPVERK